MALQELESDFRARLATELEKIGLDVEIYLSYTIETLETLGHDDEDDNTIWASLLDLLRAATDEETLPEGFGDRLKLWWKPVAEAQGVAHSAAAAATVRRLLPSTCARSPCATGSASARSDSTHATRVATPAAAAGNTSSSTDAAIKKALVARFAYETDGAPRRKAVTGASRRQQFAQKAAAAKTEDTAAMQVTSPVPVKTGDQRRLRAEAALRNGICAGKYTTRQTRADRYDQH